ncbi:RNA polymerase-binding protein RbpA [Auraticoccus monumenti]|uniref:RNA polymerase-binding protein RbpA n=1 Tax=Auraticoccus monumenti TaxID=675864 RepID=A0A1G7BMA2_9ACTN|nr:RNA polymerase-binding protein RbpA [Auraticoccus monumenti]SDE28244.1 RNA polymerase-binding protein [Auraticoccus monumenti]
MADRALRGSGLGAKSFEDEAGIEFAARQEIGFDCVRGHQFSVTFAAEADLPTLWDCPRCGSQAKRSDGVEAEVKETKPARTHWDMLLERRSISELEELLAERLDLLRAGEVGPPHLARGRRSA